MFLFMGVDMIFKVEGIDDNCAQVRKIYSTVSRTSILWGEEGKNQ